MSAPEAISVCVVGAAGRMGGRTIRRLVGHSEFVLSSVLERPGADLGALRLGGDVLVSKDAAEAVAAARVVIDFSAPPAAGRVAPACALTGTAYVTGSTGFSADDHEAIDLAAKKTPVLEASNMSVGVNVLFELVGLAAARLPQSFQPEILEIHHGHKRDAPSGTAMKLSAAIHGRRTGLNEVIGRSGQGPPRSGDELGMAALRGGDVSGEHTVFFLGNGERLELTHRATTPDIFVDGALRAAVWILSQPPGRYQMRDLLAS